MPTDPIPPDKLDGQRRFRADLVAYLDSLPVGELAELLGELPSSHQEPLQLGVLMVALNERLPNPPAVDRDLVGVSGVRVTFDHDDGVA